MIAPSFVCEITLFGCLTVWKKLRDNGDSRGEDVPFIPPHLPWCLRSSRKHMAAPCRTSQAWLNKSTSSIFAMPSQIQVPGRTSRALDCLSFLGFTAPPLEGSTTITLSEGIPFDEPFVEGTSVLVDGRSSLAISRALGDGHVER
jgi:hypothetical protein